MAPLDRADLVAFLPTTDLDRAGAFFGDLIGLLLIDEDDYAVTFDANGTPLRVVAVHDLHPPHYTAVGWLVDDIGATIDALAARGLTFERFDDMGQDERGVWTAPGGDLVAWFKDPDGTTLSLTQLVRPG